MLTQSDNLPLGELRGTYSGKRIFAIGNGPSLKDVPLDLLSSEYSIAMNRIALLYPETQWRPTFFVCTTTNIERSDWRRDILHTIDLGVTTFAWQELRSHIGERPNVHYLHCSHGPEVTQEAPDRWWSDDIAERVCKFGTSMLVALQIAAYLGFAEIYLLGCDLGFVDTRRRRGVVGRLLRAIRPDSDPNHFAKGYGTPGFHASTLNSNMVAAHRLARRASMTRQFRILNCTPGGTLEVYERLSLEDALSTKGDGSPIDSDPANLIRPAVAGPTAGGPCSD